jgi:hypothetical protein
MRAFSLIGLVLWAGCAQLFGLDETSGSDVAVLDVTHVSVGATVVSAPQSLAGQTAMFVITDDAGVHQVVATLSGNEWSAPVAGAPPIVFTLPSFEGVLAIDARHTTFPFAVLEHPSSTPASPSAMFQVQGTLPTGYVAGETLQLSIVGAWIAHAIAPPAVGSTAINTAQFALADADSLSGPRQQIATTDAVLFLRYDATGTLTAAGEAPAFAEADANTIIFPSGNVAGAIAAVTLDQTLSIPVAPADIAMRHTMTMPPPAAAATMPWAVLAAPAADLGITAGPTLRSGAVAMTDTMLATSFGNPFAKHPWPSTLVWNTSATRTYTPTGQTLAVTLSSGLFQIAPATSAAMLDMPAGLPTQITIDGMALTSDGMAITFDPAAMAEVSFVADRMANTIYQLQVLRLVPNATGTALVFENRLTALATTPPFEIPANVFKTGEQYTLRVTCLQGGFPGLSTGDLTMRALPVAGGRLDSGVFSAM